MHTTKAASRLLKPNRVRYALFAVVNGEAQHAIVDAVTLPDAVQAFYGIVATRTGAPENWHTEQAYEGVYATRTTNSDIWHC